MGGFLNQVEKVVTRRSKRSDTPSRARKTTGSETPAGQEVQINSTKAKKNNYCGWNHDRWSLAHEGMQPFFRTLAWTLFTCPQRTLQGECTLNYR